MAVNFRKEIRLGDLSNDDAELVIFCLYHNPLNEESPYFKRKLMFVKEKLLQKFENLPHFSRDAFLNFDAGYDGLAKEQFGIISKFLFATSHRNKVVIVEKESSPKSDLLIPAGIRFRQKSAALILYSDKSSGNFRYELENIQGISISNDRFTDRRVVDQRKYQPQES